MAERANVSDLDSIRLFRAQLVKFVETANTAVTESDGEIVRKMSWLSHEQTAYWTQQVRKWTEAVSKAIDAVRQKRIFKDSTGRPQSTVDEEKQLKICKQRLLEAETKLENTRRAAQQLQRDHLLYRGGVQRLMTMLASDMPAALAMLDRVVMQIEAYATGGAEWVTSDAGPDAAATAGTAESNNAMKRASDELEAEPAGEEPPVPPQSGAQPGTEP
jgi:hypothetical protein